MSGGAGDVCAHHSGTSDTRKKSIALTAPTSKQRKSENLNQRDCSPRISKSELKGIDLKNLDIFIFLVIYLSFNWLIYVNILSRSDLQLHHNYSARNEDSYIRKFRAEMSSSVKEEDETLNTNDPWGKHSPLKRLSYFEEMFVSSSSTAEESKNVID